MDNTFCTFGGNILKAYILITLISTVIGALGALMLDDEASKSNLRAIGKGWMKKLILAFIASAATPLFLELTSKSIILSDTRSEGCPVLLYFAYALILATFGEKVIKKLGELLNIGMDKMKGLLGK